MSKFLKVVPYNLVLDSKELRNLIIENPDLPIVVLCEADSVCYDYIFTYMANMSCSIGEILDAEVPYSEYVENDRDSFDEQIEEWLWDRICDEEFHDEGEPTEEYFQSELKKVKEEFEPYWKKVIRICVTNG